jgi:pentatricopeptide repeat protein
MNLAHHLLSCLAGDRFRPAARALAVVRETLPDLYLANLFLRGYCKLCRLQEARWLFDGMLSRNLVSWSSAVSMSSQHGREEDATDLLAS